MIQTNNQRIKNILLMPNLKEHYQNAYNVMKKHTVLLIEDNHINIKVGTYFLNDIGIKNIDIATRGIDSIDLYKKYPYSLVLLDIDLPDMSGFEVCKKLKSLSNNSNVPIIAVTAFAEIREDCILNGFDDFISKPVDFNIFKEIIKNGR